MSHLAVGKTVDLRVAESTVEAFLSGDRLAAHSLLPATRATAAPPTPTDDTPEERAYGKRDTGRIRR